MPSLLERQLHKLAENNSFAKDLLSLWILDKKRLTEALQSVGKIFSHYSRHDVSHSETIIENIITFLGEENIESLTATDIWLLLECAYWHDAGMLVTHKEKVDLFRDADFFEFIEGVIDSGPHELRGLAKEIHNKLSTFPIDKTLPDNIDSFEQLVATYFRSQHAERSRKAIVSPTMLNIDSDRSLLPSRIFAQLGEICALHTADFTKVLQTLEWQQNATPRNTFHPRFVACLLRLGDLLDLDDGRFSPTLEVLSGPAPASKTGHRDKHASIEKFHFTNKHISISASPQTYEGYAETARVFGMLKKEMTDLWLNWDEIAPEGWPGNMPRLGKLEVSMGNGYEVFTEGYAPELGVDAQAALELFQGANIYQERWSAIRELMQNAVDATLIRIWLSHTEDIKNNKKLSPISDEFRAIAEQYPITVRVNYDVDKNPRIFELEIEDKGIGISKKTFAHMLSVGSSAKAPKTKIIKQMPEWLRPSGIFGLGIQSAFALGAKSLQFTSTSYEDAKQREYTIPAPSRYSTSFPTIKYLQEQPPNNCGTTLSMTLELSLDVYLDGDGYSPYSLDSLQVASYQTELGYFLNEVNEFGSYIGIRVNIYLNGNKYSENRNIFEEGVTFFDNETNTVLKNLRFSFFPIEYRNINVGLAYRGNYIGIPSLNYGYVICDVDVYSDSAKDALDVSRTRFRESFHKKIYRQFPEIIKRNSDIIIKDLSSKELVFFYLFSREYSLDVRFPDNITKLMESISVGKSLTFGELIKKNSILLIKEEIDGLPMSNVQKKLQKKNLENSEHFVIYASEYESFERSKFINNSKFIISELMKEEYGYYFQLQFPPDGYSSMILFKRDEIESFTSEWLLTYIKNNFLKTVSGVSSKIIPAIEKFPDISIKDIKNKFSGNSFECFFSAGAIIDQFSLLYPNSIILPFVSHRGNDAIDTPFVEDICTFFSHGQDCMRDKMLTEYSKFIEWIDNDIMKDEEEWQRRRKLRGCTTHPNVLG